MAEAPGKYGPEIGRYQVAQGRHVAPIKEALEGLHGRGGVSVQHRGRSPEVVLTNDLRGGEASTRYTVPAVITGGSGTTYNCTLYGNGPENPATQTGVVVRFPNLATTEVIPPGTWIMAVKL
jgi:hypothetical protein